MRIVIATNSQGTAWGLEGGESYPQLVRRALDGEHDVDLVMESGWTVADFNAITERVLSGSPDVVVLQVGIVECSRRILSRIEKRVIYRIPGHGRFTKLLHDRRQRVIRARYRLGLDTRLMSPKVFERELERFVDAVENAGARPLLLRIPSFRPEYERVHFPLINDDIDLFNRVLERFEAASLLRPEDDDGSIWQVGTVHLNEHGHRLAAEQLALLVRDLVPADVP